MVQDVFCAAVVSRDGAVLAAYRQQLEELLRQEGIAARVRGFYRLCDLQTEPIDLYMLDADTIDAGAFLEALLPDRALQRYFIILYEKNPPPGLHAWPLRYAKKPPTGAELPAAIASVFREHRAFLAAHAQQVRFETREGRVMALDPRAIVYVENLNKEQKVVLEKSDFWVRRTLSALQETLAPLGFLRPHTSYLVNSRYIQAIDPAALTLRDGTVIPISKYRRKAFLEAYRQWVPPC
ncbi:MAG: LytTR family transcriptional regulator [Oscillospiraceae bacterium]|jgi:DNA-binding LytR/AlgR family response regulator|nr:LytTR family transcriptional regulator [Oscillospiraceae bacterium]